MEVYLSHVHTNFHFSREVVVLLAYLGISQFLHKKEYTVLIF